MRDERMWCLAHESYDCQIIGEPCPPVHAAPPPSATDPRDEEGAEQEGVAGV